MYDHRSEGRPFGPTVDLGRPCSTVVDRGRPWSTVIDLGRPWSTMVELLGSPWSPDSILCLDAPNPQKRNLQAGGDAKNDFCHPKNDFRRAKSKKKEPAGRRRRTDFVLNKGVGNESLKSLISRNFERLAVRPICKVSHDFGPPPPATSAE